MEYCEVKMESVLTTEEEYNKNITVEQRQDSEFNMEYNSSQMLRKKEKQYHYHGVVFSCDQCQFTGSYS